MTKINSTYMDSLEASPLSREEDSQLDEDSTYLMVQAMRRWETSPDLVHSS